MKLLILFCLLTIPASAQTYWLSNDKFINVSPASPIPDCCLQSIQLTKDKAALVDSLRRKQTLLDTTRAVGSRIIAATDERLSQALKSGNVAASALATLRAELISEALRPRFLGFGRRRWIRRTLGE